MSCIPARTWRSRGRGAAPPWPKRVTSCSLTLSTSAGAVCSDDAAVFGFLRGRLGPGFSSAFFCLPVTPLVAFCVYLRTQTAIPAQLSAVVDPTGARGGQARPCTSGCWLLLLGMGRGLSLLFVEDVLPSVLPIYLVELLQLLLGLLRREKPHLHETLLPKPREGLRTCTMDGRSGTLGRRDSACLLHSGMVQSMAVGGECGLPLPRSRPPMRSSGSRPRAPLCIPPALGLRPDG